MDVSGSESESNYESEPILKKVGCVLTHSTVQSSFQQASAKVKTVPKPVKRKVSASKAKPKSASKKKVLVDHDENAEDSPMDDLGKGDASDNDEVGTSLKAIVSTKKKTASETYTKVVYANNSRLTHIEIGF